MSYDLVSLKFLSCFKIFLVHVDISLLSNADNLAFPTKLQHIAGRLNTNRKALNRHDAERKLSVIL